MQSPNRSSSCITLTEEELVFFKFLIKSSMLIRLFQMQVIFSIRTVLVESFAIVSLSTGIVVSSRCFLSLSFARQSSHLLHTILFFVLLLFVGSNVSSAPF